MKLYSPSIIIALSSLVRSTCSFSQALPRSSTHFVSTTAAAIIKQPLAFRGSNGFLSSSSKKYSATATTALNMVRTQGLEIREEGATPLAGGMTLYVKAAQDGTSCGDCPFAHYVRIVLHEKSLPYELQPSTQETKPDWLIDSYGGSMPALRHRKECYVESDVIAQYLDFFFQDPKLNPYSKKLTAEATACTDGLFPAVAKYLKSTDDGSEVDLALKEKLEAALGKIETLLKTDGKTGPFLVGDGEQFTLLDGSLSPKLFHLFVGLKAFKENAVDIEKSFPSLKAYMDTVFERDSFKEALYPEETVVWGWSNARGD